MSLPRKINATCIKCGASFETTIWESVNTDLSPDLPKKIISGEFFEAFCPSCKHINRLEYDILYNDMVHNAMVWVVHNEEDNDDAIKEYQKLPVRFYNTTRIVPESNALREKVACLERGRDDRIIELCKVFTVANLLSQQPDFNFRNAFYTCVDEEEYIFIYDLSDNEVVCRLPDALYDFLEESYNKNPYVDKSDKKFAIVDFKWAESIMSILFPLTEDDGNKNDQIDSNAKATHDVSPCESDQNSQMHASYCHNCGEKLRDDSAFCHMCGTRILQINSENNTPASRPSPAPQEHTYTSQYSKPETPKKKKKWFSLIVIAVIAFVGGIFLFQDFTPDSSLTPVTVSNGQMIVRPATTDDPEVTVNAPKDESCFVYFDNIGNSRNDFAFYVRAGLSATVNAPTGTYMLYYATGDTWYGLEHKFGNGTDFYKSPDVFELTSDDYSYDILEITLYGVANGNMDTDPIRESDFPV